MYKLSTKDGQKIAKISKLMEEEVNKIIEKHYPQGSGRKNNYEKTKKYTVTNNAKRNYELVNNVAAKYFNSGNLNSALSAINDAVLQGMISFTDADKLIKDNNPTLLNDINDLDDEGKKKMAVNYSNIPVFRKLYGPITQKPQITEQQEEQLTSQIIAEDPTLKKIIEDKEKEKELKEKKVKEVVKSLQDTISTLEESKKTLEAKPLKDKTKIEERIDLSKDRIKTLKEEFTKNIERAQARDDKGKLIADDDFLRSVPIINQQIKFEIDTIEKLVDKDEDELFNIEQEEQRNKENIKLLEKEKESILRKLKLTVEQEEKRKEAKVKKEKYKKEGIKSDQAANLLKSNLIQFNKPKTMKNESNRTSKRH